MTEYLYNLPGRIAALPVSDQGLIIILFTIFVIMALTSWRRSMLYRRFIQGSVGSATLSMARIEVLLRSISDRLGKELDHRRSTEGEIRSAIGKIAVKKNEGRQR